MIAPFHGGNRGSNPRGDANAAPARMRVRKMKLPRHQPLVVTTRGGSVECVHYGSIAVVDRAGRLLASAGASPRAPRSRRSRRESSATIADARSAVWRRNSGCSVTEAEAAFYFLRAARNAATRLRGSPDS